MKLDFSPRFIFTLSFLFLFAFLVPSYSSYGQQTAKVFPGVTTTVGGYLEHLPDDYTTNPTKRYPILIFFHGIGENGNGTTQIWSVTANGPPKLVQNGTWPASFVVGGQTYKFIVISPQCNRFWQASDVDYAVEQIKTIYASRIDPTRIYLTGLSGGGGGLWDYLANSKYFSKNIAASVICAGASWWQSNYRVNNLVQAGEPIWAFHNQYDPTVPESGTAGWYQQLNGAGINPPMKFTMYPNVYSHDCWTVTYDPSSSNPNQIYPWMLGYSRSTLTTNSLFPHPIANAGGFQTINLPSTVTLNGNSSTSVAGSLVSYFWEKVDGPAGDQIQTPSVSNTVIHFTQSGSYTYQLTVTDSYGNSNTATTIITVNGSTTLPVPNPGSAQTITLPAQASLDGSASTDASGTITSYAWTKVSGPSGDNILSAGTAKTNISFTTSGTYVYQLAIKDNNNLSSSATVTITVNPASAPPVANAGGAQTITLPAQASLDGTASTDASGTITSYTWNKVSGPSGDNILSTGTAKTNLSFTSSGTYVYQLTVKDNNNLTSSASVTITVNAPLLIPVANAGGAQTINLPSQVSMDGSASTDASGTITSFAWSKVSGPSGDNILSAATAKTNISFITPGTYVYQLTVKDNNNLSGSATVTITVNPALLPPVSNAGGSQTITLPAQVSLDGSASSDPSGTITSYAWTKVSGPIGDNILSAGTVKSNVSFVTPGTYVYQLIVKDNNNLSNSALVTITVNPALLPPIANAGGSQSINLPSQLSLDGSASSDPSGTITSYAWIKLSGPSGDNIQSASAVKTNVSFSTSGTYVYQLTVKDNNNLSSSATVTITVIPSLLPPVANAGGTQIITLPAQVSLDGSASTDVSGTINSYAWTKISGPSGDNILSSGTVKTNISFTSAGTYLYQLTVKDNNNLSASAIVMVTVNNPILIPPKANAGSNQNVTIPSRGSLNGSGSKDSLGTINVYFWKKLSGPIGDTILSPNLVSTSVGFTNPGTYVYRLTLTDNQNLKDSAQVSIVVNSPIPFLKPIASAGNAQTITLPNRVNLDGSASTAPSGSITSYLWTKVTGPVGDTIFAPNNVKTQIGFTNTGTYYYNLQVIDNNGNSGSAEVEISVNLPIVNNLPPIANAGNAITINLPDSASLNGTGSTAPSGKIKLYKWSKVVGPTGDKIKYPDSSLTTVNFLNPGSYGYNLLVTDNNGNSSSAIVNITVNPNNNLPPFADAGGYSWINLPSMATVNAGSSHSITGTIISYRWSKLSGPAGDNILDSTAIKTQISFVQNGSYCYQVLVKDINGLTATALVYIYVLPPPVAIIKGAVSLHLPSLDTLDGSGSYSPSGKLIKYSWIKVSGPNGDKIFNAQASITSVSFSVPGTYVYQLKIVDLNNDSSNSQITVLVLDTVSNKPIIPTPPTIPPPVIPNPPATYVPVIVFANLSKVNSSSDSTLLDASKSHSAGGPIVSSNWILLSGPSTVHFSSQSGLITKVTNFQPGHYVFKLSIVDSVGDTLSKTLTYQVDPFKIAPVITKMQFYPNPVNRLGTLSVDNILSGAGMITVFDMQGRKLFQVTVQKTSDLSNFEIDFGNLTPGIYLIQYQMSNSINTMRFIKQ